MDDNNKILDTGNQESAPQLSLDLEDEKLAKFIETYEKKYDESEKIKNLIEKRKKNRKYFFGQQLKDKEFKDYEEECLYLDNVLKEAEDILRPLVLSRMPDLIVNPGVESQIERETADLVGEAVNKTLQSDELKKIITKAFRHHPIYYTAIIKYYWNPNKGKLGDVEWEVVHPDAVKVDISATNNDQKDMRIIIQDVNKTLSDWMMLFPKKEEQLKNYARRNGWKEETDEDGISFDLKVKEIWFDWKQKKEDFDVENPEFDFYSGVLWKAGKGKESILDKRRNPNWDWEGQEELFYNGQPVPQEMLPQIALLGMDVQGIERKTVHRNYFGKPRKPFIFMGYEQYGEMPYDETSRIEENIPLQDNYDIRGLQITRMINSAKGKHVFSALSGLKKETVAEMDLNDPDEDIFIEGKLGDVHTYIQKEQPSAQMFNDLNRTENRMREKLHISGAVGGEIASDVATTNQIQRESSFNIADDLSDLTVNEMITKMAEALLHMMKLRYTEDHFNMLIGTQGTDIQRRLTHDIIEDGMEVTVKASGTDKLKAERQAKDEAALGLIDPVSYFKDTGRDDPEHRAEMSFLWNNMPELYYKKVIQGQELGQVAGQVMQQNQANLAQVQPQQQMLQQPGMQPSPQDMTNIPQVPQGSPRGLVGRATGAISRLFGR